MLDTNTDADAFDIPLDCGKRSIPALIDHVAHNEPNKTFGAIPRSSANIEAGFEGITFGQYANAINTLAWWLETKKGRNHTAETLSYLAPSDFRQPMLAVAASKVGYNTLFLSPRNSLQGHLDLLKTTGCTTLITPDPAPLFAKALLATKCIQVLSIPEQLELLAGTAVPVYPFPKPFEEARNDAFIMLHTSGSTGLPKPITWTHGFFAALDSMSWAPSPAGAHSALRTLFNTRIFNAMPSFHAGGIIITLCYSAFCGVVSLLPSSHKPLDATTAVSAIKRENVKISVLLPSLLEDIVKDSMLLQGITRASSIMSTGGPLSQAVSTVLAAKTRLMNVIGTTETGVLPHLQVMDPEDSDCITISPCAGAEFRTYSHNLHELVLVRREHVEPYQPVWHVFPERQEYPTKDLFTKHPTKPDLWRYSGRADDIVVLGNGEKLNPVSMEQIIHSHPLIRSALVVGEGRYSPALLIEPAQPVDLETEKAIVIESTWPVVELANDESPAHGKIWESLVIFTTSDLPMLRSSKGAVQRKLTVEAYAKEIDEVYADKKPSSNGEVTAIIDKSSKGTFQASVHKIVVDILRMPELKLDDDFFVQGGMDSLQVLMLIRYLKAALDKVDIQADRLSSSIIYANPTSTGLSTALADLRTQPSNKNFTERTSRAQRMKSVLKKYSMNLTTEQVQSASNEDHEVVVLTGSTGALGSYLLETLINTPSVHKICSRVQFARCDFAKEKLGLDDTLFARMIDEATLIIHNAWQVDFNLMLPSFDAHIRGVRSLVDLSVQSKYRPRIFFLSSISSGLRWNVVHSGPVPETIIDDFAVPDATGYAESKYVAEQLLHKAQSLSGIPVSICRIGQIAGPVLHAQGLWNKKEWFPSMLASAKYLCVLPDSFGAVDNVDWIPIDILAQIIVELALSKKDTRIGTQVYHTVNPRMTAWPQLVPTVQACLAPNVKVVSFDACLKALMDSSRGQLGEHDSQANPALKLLDFFTNLGRGIKAPRFETDVTQGLDETMGGLQGIQGSQMEMWLGQWGFSCT